jgi:hypothetical protein
MNDILTEEAKSFKLIRPKMKNGQHKPLITYTKKLMDTLYIGLSRTQEGLLTGLKYLFGPKGASKSFKRYYYPKRFIWSSTLYVKPRVMEKIDDKTKLSVIKKNLPDFNGTAKNKIVDRRNCIVDFTDLIDLVIPDDPTIMMRSNVAAYIEQVWPEILCYILFKNDKHDKTKDIETSGESYIDELGNKVLEADAKLNGNNSDQIQLLDPAKDFPNVKDHTIDKYDIQEFIEDDPRLPNDFEEMSDEEWNNLIYLLNTSLEAFEEKLFAKTQVFSLGGTPIGLSEYGFDKYIISIPYTLKSNKFITMPYIQSKIMIPRNIKRNPDLIYQISIIQLLYKVYEAYYNGSSSNQFVSEMIKYNISFHIYSESGIGFVMNLKEIKNYFKYKPIQVARMMMNRLQMLTLTNTGMINDNDLDALEKDAIKEEVDNYYRKQAEFDEIKDDEVSDELKEDLKSVLREDIVLKSIINAKKQEKIEVIDSENNTEPKEKVNLSHMMLTSDEISKSKKALNDLDMLEKRFNKTDVNIISDNKEEASDITLTNSDLDSILNTNSDDGEDVIDNYEPEEDENIVEEANDETSMSSDLEDQDEKEYDSDIDKFEDMYQFDETDNIEEITDEEEPEYVEIKPSKKGPVKIEKTKTTEVIRTPAEIKRINILKEKYKSIQIDGKKIEDIIGKSKDISITKSVEERNLRTKDKTVSNFNITDFQKSYINQNYQSDIINAVRSLSINKADPLYMTDAKVEDSSDQFSEKLTYTFTLEDENKKKHNLKFDVPKINENGLVKISGNEKYLKKQLIRKPIVKIGPDKVYVTTEMNSYQVMRTGVLLNKGSEVIRRLFGEYLIDKPNVTVERGNCEEDNADYLTTLEYDILAKNYFFIKINDEKSKFGEHIEIFFSQKAIRERIEKFSIVTGYENNSIPDNILPVAINYTRHTLISLDMNKNNSINTTIINILNDTLKDPELIEFVKQVKTPKRRICTKIEIQSFTVPLIAFLNYLFTWDKVKEYFPENEIEFSDKQIKNTNKLSIKFYNGYLYYNQYPIRGAIFLNGLTELGCENYNYEDLNNQGMYLNYTQNKFKTRNVVKGWVTAKETMLDLKTLQILEALNLPTDFLEIFLYCNDLLVDNHVLPESDITNYRIRSNEIISECLYKVINEYYTQYKKRIGKKTSMSIPRNAVMAKVYKTEILENYNAISPISEIRGLGLTTFKGPGGTKLDQAFTLGKRAFDPSYFGVFAMSTPDNFNAGVIKELALDCNIVNTLGFIGQTDTKNFNLNQISAISEAITPFCNSVDDPSRISFVSAQNNHVGGMMNSSLPPVRTGVEQMIPYHSSGNFVKKAKQDGVITDVDEIGKKIFITYKDGSKDVIDYNDIMLKNSDAFNKAEYKAFVKVGQKVKKDDVLSADSRFFKVDPITKQLVYTQAINGMFAIMEGSYTEDDSDLISATFADKLRMDFTKRKQISIKAMDTIIEYKEIGDHVELGDPIFVFDESGTFEEEQDDSEDSMYQLLFENLDSETLATMIHQTPKANASGTITDMRVYWTVPINKMSKSVAKFVNKYISKIRKEIQVEEEFSGKPSEKRKLIQMTKTDLGYDMINGQSVDPDGGIVIEYFISADDTMSSGDKIALNSSLKTVNSMVIEKEVEPYTESGLKLDGIFSLISINARMINSVWYNGFLGDILYKFSKKWAKDFLKDIGEEIPNNEREITI